MKSLVTTLIAVGLISPGVIYADSFDNYVQHIKEAAEAGNGIVVETHSSASSGGQTAAAGQAVTDGDVSASSHVETNINSNSSSGSVQVHVETSQNGKTETKDYKAAVKPGEPVKVNVSAHADSGGSNVETKVNGESAVSEDETASSSEEEVGSTPIDMEVGTETGFEKALMMVPNFFKKIFSFFWGW